MANVIYFPSYISFETALSIYGIIPEVVYPIISATFKPTRVFKLDNQVWRYLTIKKQAFTGYLRKNEYFIADPEKALADYLYFVALGKKPLNSRLDLSRVNTKLLRKYISLFSNRRLEKLVKELC